jgi:hypothetical protein
MWPGCRGTTKEASEEQENKPGNTNEKNISKENIKALLSEAQINQTSDVNKTLPNTTPQNVNGGQKR